MSLKLNQHISREFNAELERIRSQVLRMGGLVEAQLVQAIRALLEADVDLAMQVRKADKRINELEVEIDGECTEIVARRQPAATDLRLIMGVSKTISDLERIGDEAKRIAKMVDTDLAGHLPEHMSMEIGYMADLARGMLHDVLDAFARLDADDALKIAQRDRQVDLKYESITRQLITYMTQGAKNHSNGTFGHVAGAFARVNWRSITKCGRAFDLSGAWGRICGMCRWMICWGDYHTASKKLAV